MNCRLCRSHHLEKVIDLGDLPISHHIRKNGEAVKTSNMVFHSCDKCGLLQIAEPSEHLPGINTYTTGFHKPKHLEELASLVSGNRALDVGCNDGALMDVLAKRGFSCVGVEPNQIAASIAVKTHEVINKCFTLDLAKAMTAKRGKFDAVFCRHVLEHIDDLHAFMEALDHVVSDKGALVIELPSTEDGLRDSTAAMLWEEHLSYFMECHVERLLTEYGFKAEKRYYAAAGGSVAYIAKRIKKPDYTAYAKEIEAHAESLRAAVNKAERVVLYGAGHRAAVILNHAKIYPVRVFDDREELHWKLFHNTPITKFQDIGPCLVLLGVGEEHEYKIKSKFKEATFLSLFRGG